MKHHKRKRSEFTYREIVRSLLWYYWDYIGENCRERKLYYKYRRKYDEKYLIKIPKDVY